ncbi:hypothetical protein BDP81DRAFT_430549 [Colletotrichum phormii]|uniref:Heterokaryon incompatibility domain-containing protein n=1 Tax=Colletotrichum phormii TaxID=359342 RepID=A0AAJ0EGC0_9PEZI|nr:uncharacterized protein BDP81DRAFT_430549 [Colletotrichum phormii]KAK1635906.1 hypothetical protein BDP81DRAFT_430549 [Colletotrichum phormii]
MAHIYAKADLTIAATKSSDASGGCFANTGNEYMSKLVPGCNNTYVLHKLPEFPLMSSEHQIGKSSGWPLMNRGWAYQEMRLSPRVLHFCAQEVIWVCRDAQKSESKDNDKDLTSKDGWARISFSHIPYGILEKDPKYLWYRTVQEYSRLRLSKQEDKMAALAGLAEQMQNLRPGDRYLVGLWKTLLHDLLWFLEGRYKAPKPRITRYPSWSWASSPFQVTWFSGLNKSLKCTQVEDIKLANQGPSHMADCVEATITLRAPLLDASSLLTACQAFRKQRAYQAFTGIGPVPGRRKLHWPFGHLYFDPFNAVITNLDHLYVSYYASDSGSPVKDLTPAECSGYLIPLAAENDFSLGFGAIHVQRDQSSDCYRRVGWAELGHPAAPYSNNKPELKRKSMENLATVRRLLEDLPTHRITLI